MSAVTVPLDFENRLSSDMRSIADAKGITVAQIARATGYPASTLRRKLSGKPGRLTAGEVLIVCEALGADIVEVWGRAMGTQGGDS